MIVVSCDLAQVSVIKLRSPSGDDKDNG